MIKLITVTWSYDDSFDIKNTFLYKSFLKENNEKDLIHFHYNRNNYKNLEDEFYKKYDYQYEYLIYKIFLMKDKLYNIDTDYIIFSDATDVICLGDIKSILPPENVLFSTEINKYPSNMRNWGVDYPQEEQKNKRFLNSGLFISSKENYIKLLDNVITNIFPKNLKTFGGDQGIFIYHYLSKMLPKIELDIESKLFLSTFDRNPNDFLNHKFPIFIHDNGWNWGSPRFITRFNL
jgi:hypothetical protein